MKLCIFISSFAIFISSFTSTLGANLDILEGKNCLRVDKYCQRGDTIVKEEIKNSKSSEISNNKIPVSIIKIISLKCFKNNCILYSGTSTAYVSWILGILAVLALVGILLLLLCTGACAGCCLCCGGAAGDSNKKEKK